MANHPNRTRVNVERARAREYRFWQAEMDYFIRELNDPYRAQFKDDLDRKLARATAHRDSYA